MTGYLKDLLDALIPCAILWGILAFSMHRDRSRYRNCTFLMIALLWTIPFIATIAGSYYRYVMLGSILLIFLAILLVPIILIMNGIVMLKRESRSFANMLSLFLGIVIGIGEFATFGFFAFAGFDIYDRINLEIIARNLPIMFLFISISVIYVSLSIVSFVIYTKFLELLPIKRDFDYVIVLGAGLINGNQVSKLLAGRLDKAIQIYEKDPTPPYIIPSGGQGGDETIPEAVAMAGYLKEHGIPEEMILLEDQSKTTNENLRNSKAILDAREGRKYTAVVSSNYHVYRALRLCRKIGLKSVGVGGKVAAYYWPSALIREYVAVHSEKKHAIIFILGWLIMISPVLIMMAIG